MCMSRGFVGGGAAGCAWGGGAAGGEGCAGGVGGVAEREGAGGGPAAACFAAAWSTAGAAAAAGCPVEGAAGGSTGASASGGATGDGMGGAAGAAPAAVCAGEAGAASAAGAGRRSAMTPARTLTTSTPPTAAIAPHGLREGGGVSEAERVRLWRRSGGSRRAGGARSTRLPRNERLGRHRGRVGGHRREHGRRRSRDAEHARDGEGAALVFGRGEGRERLGELGDVRVALRHLAPHAAGDDRRDPRGHVRPQRGDGLGRVLEHLGHDLGRGLGHEGRPPHEQLVEDDPERPDVRALVDALGRQQLLRATCNRACPSRSPSWSARRPRGRSTLEMPKSSTLTMGLRPGCSARKRLEGLRSRCTMRSAWACASASQVSSRYLTASGMGSGPRVRKLVGEVAALQVLHDHERGAVVEATDVDDAGHVLAMDLRRRAGLAREALDDLGDALRVREQALDRDPLVELHVPGRDHDAHAALAEDPFDQVLASQDRADDRVRHNPCPRLRYQNSALRVSASSAPFPPRRARGSHRGPPRRCACASPGCRAPSSRAPKSMGAPKTMWIGGPGR